MKDCSIQLTNDPGDLARVAQALGRRGVNIKALAGLSIGGMAMARILPDDIVAARSARGINLEAIYITGIAGDLIELAIVSDNPKKTKKVLEEF